MKIGNINLSWFGHDTFMFEGEKIVYTDPYVLPANPKKADLILVTHDHYDHCDIGKIRQIQKADTIIVTTADCAKKLSGDVRVMKPGEKLEIGDIVIRAVPAYNLNKSFHEKKKEWLGFLFTIDKTTFYIAGDTDLIPEMNEIHPDIALVPIGGTYTMTLNEAVEAVLTMKPKIAIPMHYNTFDGIEADPREFKKRVLSRNPGIKVEIL